MTDFLRYAEFLAGVLVAVTMCIGSYDAMLAFVALAAYLRYARASA